MKRKKGGRVKKNRYTGPPDISNILAVLLFMSGGLVWASPEVKRKEGIMRVLQGVE